MISTCVTISPATKRVVQGGPLRKNNLSCSSKNSVKKYLTTKHSGPATKKKLFCGFPNPDREIVYKIRKTKYDTTLFSVKVLFLSFLLWYLRLPLKNIYKKIIQLIVGVRLSFRLIYTSI